MTGVEMAHRRHLVKKKREVREGREESTYRSRLCEVRKARNVEVGAWGRQAATPAERAARSTGDRMTTLKAEKLYRKTKQESGSNTRGQSYVIRKVIVKEEVFEEGGEEDVVEAAASRSIRSKSLCD